MDSRNTWLIISGRLLLSYAIWLILPILVVEVAAPSIAAAFGFSSLRIVKESPLFLLAVQWASAALVAVAIFCMARWLDRRQLLELGVARSKGMIEYLALGMCLGLLVPLTRLLILWAIGSYRIEATRLFAVDWWSYALIVLSSVPGVWSQEIVFRGYTLANLRDRLNARWAIPVCALLSLIPYLVGRQTTWQGPVSSTMVGLLLALAFLHQRSLWLPAWVQTAAILIGTLIPHVAFSQRTSIQDLDRMTLDLADAAGVLAAMVLLSVLSVRQRLAKKSHQIRSVLEVRERLASSPDVESSLQTILDGAMKDLGAETAAVLTARKDSGEAEVRSFRSSRDMVIGRSYDLAPFAEYECLRSKRSISRTVGDRPCIVGGRSIHCAPVSCRGEVIGFLVLGSATRRVLEEDDLSVLELYSGLAATVLETASLTIEPVKETQETKQRSYRVEPGGNYLVEDDIDLAYEIFRDSIMSGMEGLCITRTLPERLRQRFGLKKTPVVWLTDEAVEGTATVRTLQELSIMISSYVEKAERPIILIDGLEYLVSRFEFNPVYQFLQTKRSQIERTGSILIITVFKDALDAREVRLLERELQLFS